MKILFISSLKRPNKYLYSDNSTRFRCFNPAEDLNDLGHIGDVCSLDNFDMRYIDCYDAFIFHRPSLCKRLEKALSCLSSNGKLYIADYDDLIFDERYTEESPLYFSDMASLNHLRHIYRKNLMTMRLFSHITVSTEALKKAVSLCHPYANVTVIHNGLSKRWVAFNVNQINKGRPPKQKIISYLPGSSTHDHDFMEVEDVLSDYLNAYNDVFLQIVGPLNFNRKKFRTDRLITGGLVSYEKLPKLISDSWVTIAPLQNTLYNNCKTGIKFIESAAFGVPVIASPIPEMLRYADKGLLFVAYDRDDWWKAFDTLRNRELYTSISQQIRDFSYRHCMSYIETDKMIRMINGHLNDEVRADGKSSVRRHRFIYDLKPGAPVKTFQRSRITRLARKLFRDPRKFILDSKIMRLGALRTLFEQKTLDGKPKLKDNAVYSRRLWQKN